MKHSVVTQAKVEFRDEPPKEYLNALVEVAMYDINLNDGQGTLYIIAPGLTSPWEVCDDINWKPENTEVIFETEFNITDYVLEVDKNV